MYEDSGGIEGSVPLIGTSTGTMWVLNRFSILNDLVEGEHQVVAIESDMLPTDDEFVDVT